MKIYDRNLNSTSAADTGRAQESKNLSRTGTGDSRSTGVSAVNDRVEFSGTMSRLSRTLATFDTSRADKVQTLTAEYQSGNYIPDSAATSRGMVAEAMSSGLQ
jgi:hypothetical protein